MCKRAHAVKFSLSLNRRITAESQAVYCWHQEQIWLSLYSHLLEHWKGSASSVIIEKHLRYAGAVNVVPLRSKNTD